LADTSDSFSRFCPTLNKSVNKQKLRDRLNNLPNLTPGDQEIDPGQTNNEKVNDIINKVKDDIE